MELIKIIVNVILILFIYKFVIFCFMIFLKGDVLMNKNIMKNIILMIILLLLGIVLF